jgi:hypothetical protein
MFSQSDKAIFEQKILPQIVEKLAEYDHLEILGNHEWKVCFNFEKDYTSLSMNELKKQHALILEDEKNLSCLDLVAKYYRGLVYFRARELMRVDENVKLIFHAEFGICYTTAMRYVTFAALIKRYPRLMACGLPYAQITKHHTRLLDHLKTDTGLHDKLSQPLNVSAQNKPVDIHPSDICVPKTITSTSTNPDHAYDDGDDISNIEARWFKETATNGEMFNDSYSDDVVLKLADGMEKNML